MIGKSYDGTLANGVAATGVAGLKTIVPISAISYWYAYSRLNGIRFTTHYPTFLASRHELDRRAACAGRPTRVSAADGDETGDLNAFWDDRDYLSDVGNVTASVFVVARLPGRQREARPVQHVVGRSCGERRPAQAVAPARRATSTRSTRAAPRGSRRCTAGSTTGCCGVDNGIMGEPRVDIEDAADVWHTYADWPIPGSTPTPVYLRAAGRGGRRRSASAPAAPADTLTLHRARARPRRP